MFRRISALTGAAVVGAAALMGIFSAGTASAAPGCPDVHWIGVAGSGERVDPTADGGMGRVVYRSLQDFSRMVQRDGRTMTAEAVEYPAVAVPADGDLIGHWKRNWLRHDDGDIATFLGETATTIGGLPPLASGMRVHYPAP